ncbi:hypothetical protein DAVIS_03916 [Mycobacterium marinum]|uniref:Transmembrane protein n=1 Tax=Mycobacterium marinum TaxID=1781 RepID=A0A3E2MSB3_MYCMR|nr:hypothetical protein DAVIS_03916 [Mycobacterium marinum]
MADLDRLTAQLMSSQAQAVKDTRKGVSVAIVLVALALPACIALESMGPEAQPGAEDLSLSIAIALCGIAMLLTGIALGDLWHTKSRNADDMRAGAQRGSDLVAAPPTGSGAAVSCTVLASADAGLGPAEGVSPFTVAEHTAPSPLTAELGSALAGLPGHGRRAHRTEPAHR